MKKKFDEYDTTTWTLKQLKKRAIGLHCAINICETYSTGDLHDYDAIKAELESRGYECQESKSLSIVRV
jgi:hypothetical protein